MAGWLESLLCRETWLGYLIDQVFTFIADFVAHDYDAALVFDGVHETADAPVLALVAPKS